MMEALLYAMKLLETLPTLLAAGKDITDLVNHGNAALKTMQAEGRGPTAQETADLDAKIKALRDELHAE